MMTSLPDTDSAPDLPEAIVAHRIWPITRGTMSYQTPLDAELGSLGLLRGWEAELYKAGGMKALARCRCVDRMLSRKGICDAAYHSFGSFASVQPVVIATSCGLYSYRSIENLKADRTLGGNVPRSVKDGVIVYGTVWIWGKVFEHDMGYRSEYAKIRSLDGIVLKRAIRPARGKIVKYSNWTAKGRKVNTLLDVLRKKYGVEQP